MGQIYVAYRHDEAAAISGRVADRLRALFGEQAVLKDVDASGESAAQRIGEAVSQCSAMAVLIGPRWLTGVLANPQDQTSVEIAAGQRRTIPMIPVLSHGATLPDPRLLPQWFWPLFARGYLVLGPEATFDRDMLALTETLRRYAPAGGYRPNAGPQRTRGPALPGEVGAAARRAALGRRALLIAVVLAVVIASLASGIALLAPRLTAANAFSYSSDTRLLDIANPPGTDEAWVVGGTLEACVLLHYAGGRWSRVGCPLAGELDSISFANSGDGWAVGGDYESCRLLHFSRGSWSQVSCPVAALDETPTVRMDAHGGGWIVGGQSTLRFTGGRWSVYTGVVPLGGLRTLAVSGTGDAWAAADDGFHQVVDGVWESVDTPQLKVDAYFESLDFARSTDEGWAVGYEGPLQRAYIAEYQDGQWQAHTPQPSVGNVDLVRVGQFGDVWAAGGVTTKQSLLPTGLIMRYASGRWQTLGDPIAGIIYGITDVADGDAWAVGDTGDTGNANAALLWYHNGYWRIFHT